jgi:hypothetical protein
MLVRCARYFLTRGILFSLRILLLVLIIVRSPRCPHVREVCRNRSLHPQFDVLYLKNAEVQSFNTCGYCRWARHKPGSSQGWPGCCRPPAQSEYRLIQAADWKSVSIIHNIPIPPEIKAILDTMTTPARSSAKPSMPPLDRKSSGGSGGTSSSTKTSPTTAKPASVASSKPRTTSASPATVSKSVEKDKSSSSPNRKQTDLEPNTPPRRNSASRVLQPASKISPPAAKGPVLTQTPERRRTAAVPSNNSSSVSKSSSLTPSRHTKEDDNLSSASSSSGGSGSLSDSTVTSDGGFTDYLSEESEAELQRQAEAKAALLAQIQAEELEFKAARQQLAHVDLRPPKSWNPTNLTNAPRLTNATTKG